MLQDQLNQVLTPDQQRALKERAVLIAKCRNDVQMQAAVRKLCRDGLPDGTPGYLFWFRMFATVYEPRNSTDFQRLPFVPYPFQEVELKNLHETIEKGQGIVGDPTNLLFIKSRDMGVTWLVISYFLWDWLFNNGSYLVGHRKQEEVDKIGDMATLFEKMRWLLRGLPQWMIPQGFDWRTDSKENMLRNPAGGEIVGESSNPEFGRGDRRKAILFDEFPVWDHDTSAWKAAAGSTYVRIAIGTPKGRYNKFARLARHEKDEESCIVREIHWRLHPIKAIGAQCINGKWTSPWYEREKKRLSAEDVASELDMSFEKSHKGIVFPTYGTGHQRRGLMPAPGFPILRIWDPGLTFAVLFLQVDNYRRFRCLKELIVEQARIRVIAEQVLHISNDHRGKFADFSFEDCGDPAGSWTGNSAQEDPEYTILSREYGINVDWEFMSRMPPKNRVKARIVGITEYLTRYVGANDPNLDGPSLLVDPDECPRLHEALEGAYKYKVDVNNNVMDAIQEAHPYEDVVDCLGYGIVYKQGAYMNNPNSGGYDEEDDQDGGSSYMWHQGVSRC